MVVALFAGRERAEPVEKPVVAEQSASELAVEFVLVAHTEPASGQLAGTQVVGQYSALVEQNSSEPPLSLLGIVSFVGLSEAGVR